MTADHLKGVLPWQAQDTETARREFAEIAPKLSTVQLFQHFDHPRWGDIAESELERRRQARENGALTSVRCADERDTIN